MQTKKQKLIEGLNNAITALKNGTVYYNWANQNSCNCGIVAQAILRVNKVELSSLYVDARRKVKQLNHDTYEPVNTWREAVQHLCPITGEPMAEVFRRLFDAGMSKEDIVHLEYMNNPAIVEKSGILNQPQKITKIPHKYFGWLGIKVDKHENYYEQKQNLILYLSAWVQILKEGGKYKESVSELSIEQLNDELLNAVADEKYEYATVLRDTINERIINK